MHTTKRNTVRRERAQRASLVAGFMAGHTEHGRISPMSRTDAERMASAIRHGFDLWAWLQGRVQFLTPAQVDTAIALGMSEWVESAVNGADSADPFFTIRDGWAVVRKHYPSALSIETRCAGGRDGHSCWAYGPVYLSPATAKAAGHTHKIKCGCGFVSRPL